MSDELSENEKRKIALGFFAQNQIYWTTALLTTIFGAFTLLELMRVESGVTRDVVFVYYELLSLAAGITVLKWLVQVRAADKLVDKLGLRTVVITDIVKDDPLPFGSWRVLQGKRAPAGACFLVFVIIGALGFVVFL